MKLWAVCFEPEDWLAFREARRFNPSDRVESTLPSAFPFYGALRTAILKKLRGSSLDPRKIELSEEEKEVIGNSEKAGALSFFGPFIFEKAKDGEKYYLPAPKNIYVLEERDQKRRFKTMPVLKLQEKIEVGHLKLDLAWIPEFEGAEEAKGDYIELKEMERLRRGEEFKPAKPENFSKETRLGIALESDSKHAAEGMIYTFTYYRFKNGGFAMFTDDERTLELIRKNNIEEDGVFLGAKQRWAKVSIKELETEVFEPLEGKTSISLVTPAIFKEGGIAPESGKFEDVNIVAITGKKKTVISGWDLANNRPKPIYHAASPGTVYYLKAPLNRDSISEKFSDFGFGRFVYMRWEYFGKGDKRI